MAAFKRPFRIFASVLTFTYFAIYCTILFSTSFLPYVMDNNESFSSLWHASNLYNFGPSKTFGLADESFSPDLPAHPYVHTHQGNFPRIFAFLIYVLGARTIETQIGVTTLTVGFATMLLAYRFFSRCAGPLLAFIVSTVLISDYIFYAQWNVVTYRVWHAFFVFSSLLCVYGLGTSRRRLWLILSIVNYLALFYFEYAFVAFINILAGLYAGLVHWRKPRIMVTCWLTQAVGGLATSLFLIAQLVGYLGVDGLLTDAYITYVARNAAQNPQLLSQIAQFYESHRVAFWYNFVDSSSLRTPAAFLGSLFVSAFQVFTPLLSLIVFVLIAGGLLGETVTSRSLAPSGGVRLRAWLARALPTNVARILSPTAAIPGGGKSSAWTSPVQRALVLHTRLFTLRISASVEIPQRGRSTRMMQPRTSWLVKALILAVSFHVFLAVTLRDRAFEGLTSIAIGPVWSTGGFGTLAAAVGAIVLAVLLSVLAGGWRRFASLPMSRVALAGILVLGTAYAVGHQSALYQQALSILWLDQLEARVPEVIGRAALVTATVLAATTVLVTTPRLIGRQAAREFIPIARYLACAVIAYAGTYLLVPGYVYSGYLVRSAPLTVFLTDPLIGAATYLVIRAAARAFRRVRANVTRTNRRLHAPCPGRFGSTFVPLVTGSAAMVLLAGALTMYLSGFWIYLQASYVQLLPPTHFAFLSMLSEAPFARSSFAVNEYAAPVAAFTGQWAYYDPKISDGQVQLSDQGFQFERDTETYLWLADRRENPAYQRPEYFACMIPQSFETLVHRLKPELGIGTNSECSTLGIVALARGRKGSALRPQVVASDTSGKDYWAILKLSWDYPPFLELLSAQAAPGDARVLLEQQPFGGGARLSPHYRFAQQDGKPEDGTVVRLYSVDSQGRPGCILGLTTTSEPFQVSATFRGYVRAAVTPHTATAEGNEYFSSVTPMGLPVDNAAAGCP
jgi:hypothetical protein